MNDRQGRARSMRVITAGVCLLLGPQARAETVQLVRRDQEQRVDVLVDGQPFTSYRWTPDIARPVLWPIRTAGGQVITRGFPLEPRPGEPDDHPHHVGLWFSYGNVGGVDFWANKGRFGINLFRRRGRIVHRGVEAMAGGALTVRADWLTADGEPLVHEVSRFLFAAGAGRRSIDRLVTLTTPKRSLPWPDNKEGLFALRLGPTGQYRSSEGVVGDAVWGTRARWMMSTTEVDGQPVTVAILDHPNNPGFPTHWHARGYGLFAANPLGQRVFSKGKQRLGFTLEAGRPARFAYRVVILSRHASAEDIEAESRRFAGGR